MAFLLQGSRQRSMSSESVSREVRHISSRTRMMLQLQTRRSSVSRAAWQPGRGRLTRSEFAKIGQAHRSRRRSSWAASVRRDFINSVLDQMTLTGVSVERIGRALDEVATRKEEEGEGEEEEEEENAHVVGKGKFREALVNAGISLSKREVNSFFDDLDARDRGKIDFREFLDVLSSHRGLVMEERARRVHLGDSVADKEEAWGRVASAEVRSGRSLGSVAEVGGCEEDGPESRQRASDEHRSRARQRAIGEQEGSRARQQATEEDKRKFRQQAAQRYRPAAQQRAADDEQPTPTQPSTEVERSGRDEKHISRHQRHTHAAKQIQATWRGNRGRLRYRMHAAEIERFRVEHGRHAAEIQRMYRGYAVRKQGARQRKLRAGRRASSAKIVSM